MPESGIKDKKFSIHRVTTSHWEWSRGELRSLKIFEIKWNLHSTPSSTIRQSLSCTSELFRIVALRVLVGLIARNAENMLWQLNEWYLLFFDSFYWRIVRAMTERSLHFTAKGFKSQVVAIADDTINPKSKRYGIIDKEVRTISWIVPIDKL